MTTTTVKAAPSAADAPPSYAFSDSEVGKRLAMTKRSAHDEDNSEARLPL